METTTVLWNDIPVEATVPTPIAAWEPGLAVRTVRRTEQAAAAVRRAGELGAGHLEPAARLLLRSEGLASSAIEGLRATAADVTVAEAAGAGDVGGAPVGDTAAWVADNLAVVTDALAEPGPLTHELLWRWHRRLMRNSPTIEADDVGRYRDRLGWVGGRNPRVAAHVAAPAEMIAGAMDDLLRFAARTDLDAVTQAAVLHAQFETIHPFADGNGRLGRVLIGRTLAERVGVAVPPPVSLQLARDIGGYQSGLTLYRQDQIDPWVSWFADAVHAAAETATTVLAAVVELQHRWRRQLAGVRSDSVAHQLLELLPAHPVLSTATAAELTGVSRRAAANALAELTDRDVLADAGARPRGPGRPERWWVAHGLLELLGR